MRQANSTFTKRGLHRLSHKRHTSPNEDFEIPYEAKIPVSPRVVAVHSPEIRHGKRHKERMLKTISFYSSILLRVFGALSGPFFCQVQEVFSLYCD